MPLAADVGGASVGARRLYGIGRVRRVQENASGRAAMFDLPAYRLSVPARASRFTLESTAAIVPSVHHRTNVSFHQISHSVAEAVL